MLEFKPKLNIDSPLAEPDVYIRDLDADFEVSYPHGDFIISRTKTGNILSRYRDDCWDLSPYAIHSRAHSIIYFKKTIPNEGSVLFDEYKWIMFIIIFIADSGRSGFLSISTICGHANSVAFLAKYCLAQKISIRDFLKNEKEVRKFFGQATITKRKKERISFIFQYLNKLDKIITGFDLCNEMKINFAKTLKSDKPKQTVVIPTRILSEIISSCTEFLRKYSEVEEKFLTLVKKSNENIAFGRSKGRQKSNCPGIATLEDDFNTACNKLGLSVYMNKNNIFDLHGVSRHLRKIQYACKLLIHLYTGMRDDEVSRLMYDCLHTEKTVNGRVFRIVGETTKLVGLKKAERWITSPEIEPAIHIAKGISKTIAEGIGISDHILFLPVSNLNFSPSSKNSKNLLQSGFNDIKNSIFSILIEESDVKELQKISPSADWLSDPKFQIGAIWPIATHQFRRTLAVYAAQSGLVSLPSLKRQLKHITNEMTLYYAASSSFSSSLFGNNKMHFRHEFNESKLYGEGLGYIYNLLLSDQALHGVQGIWLEKHERKNDEIHILASRENTLKRFKRGELAYADTPLGACLSREACDKKPMRAVSACISCDKAVIIEAKLEKVIFYQNALLEDLNQGSMEYRMEKEQLDDLCRLHAQIQRKNNVSTG
jgi:hypothetical protein